MDSSANRGLLVGLSSGALAFLLLAGLGAALWLSGCGQEPGRQGGLEPDIYPREEFTDLLMGKTGDEVVGAVGKPDRTAEDSEFEYWHYRKRTRDAVTHKVDSDAQVIFQHGRVVRINY